jgi:hypothetical protein
VSNSAIPISAGSGTNVDTWSIGGDHQQIVVIRSYPAATATLTNVTSSATSVQLVAANTARLGLVIYNDSTSLLYVKFGTTASTTSYTLEVPNDDWVTLPGDMGVVFTGRIDGIWASANGAARLTELTA